MTTALNITADNRDLSKLADLIRDIGFTMMTTASENGTLHSRPMATQQINERDAFDGVLWFFTALQSGKTHDIREDQHVNLAYADPKANRYVSVAGSASVVVDPGKAKELWKPIYKAFFPGGLEDPNLGLIRVDIESAEYWDNPSSKMVQAFGFVKALVTGKPEAMGENKRMDLSADSVTRAPESGAL